MPKIRVALRVRPLSQREIVENFPVVVTVENNSAFITDIRVPERPSADSRPRYRQFDFDHTFWFSPSESQATNDGRGHCHYRRPAASASQNEVYMEMGPYLEKAILAGYNACLLAYGQSGSGKTHTMIGSREDPGIIPRLCRSLWDKLGESYPPQSPEKPSFRMEVSFLEIYREKVRDLLNPDNILLKLREHPQLGPHVQGLTRLEVNGETSLLDLLWEGERRRASGNTSSNRRSSRSHAIWTLYLTVLNATAISTGNSSNQVNSDSQSGAVMLRRGSYRGGRLSETPEKADGDDSTKRIITNQVHLVDLAGSEKADCTTAKSLLAEGADINRSLVALGNVISALAEKAQYVPYRDSALTWLLKDSIGGNASTSIIITASPSSHCHAQTLNSLRFAQRARLVENTPKINLAPASSTHYGPYGFLSVMSAMELKKDISRLAKIIKTAQTNGGILRGLAPRAGWTRLIHAIEGIGQAEKEQVRLQRERACSEDTSASSSLEAASSSSTRGVEGGVTSSSSSATITAAKSLNDVMVQADMEKRNHLLNLRRRPSRQSESALAQATTSSSSPSHSPSKIVGTEVFIPTSNSYKCLTWQQEEAHLVPKPLSSSTSSLVSSDDCGEDGNASLPLPSSNCQIHHLKYFLEVHYPVAHNLDHASRISERIHGNIVDENYQQKTELIPMEVPDSAIESSTTLLVQEQVPTLVNSRDLEDELCEQVKESLQVNSSKSETILVGQIAKESKEYLFPLKCKHFASAISLPIAPFESSDENDFDEPEEAPLSHPGHVYRTVQPQILKSLQSSERNCTFDDHCYLTAAECPLSQIPSMILSSSSSSYESINMPDTVRPVHLIREFSETNDISEDQAEDFTVENEVFREDFQPPVANMCMVPGQPMETAVPIEILVAEPNCFDNTPCYNPINGVSDSKFRNYFAKELHQMERMGKQIKTLLQMTQRFNVVKPYLDEISNLQNSDHSRPDPVLDAHIESCSGWNVDVELSKVHQEIRQLNKVLKTGLGTEGMANSAAESKAKDKRPINSRISKQTVNSSSSTIHNDAGGVTSDESCSIDADGYFQTSFAHTRHIPLLSSKTSASSSRDTPTHRPHYNLNIHHPFVQAKGSISQPVMSSSSNNDSITSATVTTAQPQEDLYFRPNIFSSPMQQKYPTSYGNWKGCGEEGGSSGVLHYPRVYLQSNPPLHPHAVKSMELFHPRQSTSDQYYRSNSNMSSGSSNAGLNPQNAVKTSSGRFPVNSSLSEPRNFNGQSSNQGLARLSESSTNFQSNLHNQAHHRHRHVKQLPSANSFNPDEIRSHRQLYENRLYGEPPVKVEKGLQEGKGLEGWDYVRVKNGVGESPECNNYPMHFQYPQNHRHERSATVDSLDLCSCGDTNSKYSVSTGLPASSLEKSSSRSQFSSFGGSTTTDTSEYLLSGSRLPANNDYHYHHYQSNYRGQNQSHPNHQHQHSRFSSSDTEGHSYLRNSDNSTPPVSTHQQTLYKIPFSQQINRHENF